METLGTRWEAEWRKRKRKQRCPEAAFFMEMEDEAEAVKTRSIVVEVEAAKKKSLEAEVVKIYLVHRFLRS